MTGPSSAGTKALPQTTQLGQGNLELKHQYFNQLWNKVEAVKAGDYKVIDSEGGVHTGKLNAEGMHVLSGLPPGMATIFYS